MSYLGAAESWAAGRGLRIPYAPWSDPDSTAPLRIFAPGYPLVLGTAIRLGAPSVTFARWIQALAAGAAAALLAWLLDSLAGASAAAIGTTALLLTPAIVRDYIAVLSEPLFLAGVVLTILLMVEGAERPLRYGAAAAAAVAVRYAGAALAAAAVLWACLTPGDRRARVGRAIQAAAPTLVLALLWFARTAQVARSSPVTVTRPLLRVGATLRQGADELAFTLAPGLDDTPWLAPAALLVAVLAVVVIAWSRRRGLDPRARAMHQVAGLVAGCYLGLVILAKTFVGHGIPLDQRILSPLLLCGALALVPAVRLGLARWPLAARLLAGLGIAAWLGGALVSVKDLDDDISVNGYDFAESGWRHSETLAWLRREGAAFALYTNHPVPIYYYLHRPSRDLPARLAPDTLRQFAERFAARPSALVAFADTTWGDAVPARILAQALSLREAAHLADGTVWLSPVSAGSSSPPPDRPRGPASARHR